MFTRAGGSSYYFLKITKPSFEEIIQEIDNAIVGGSGLLNSNLDSANPSYVIDAGVDNLNKLDKKESLKDEDKGNRIGEVGPHIQHGFQNEFITDVAVTMGTSIRK